MLEEHKSIPYLKVGTNKPTRYYTNLLGNRLKKNHEAAVQALGTAITMALNVANMARDKGFAELVKLFTDTVEVDGRPVSRVTIVLARTFEFREAFKDFQAFVAPQQPLKS